MLDVLPDWALCLGVIAALAAISAWATASCGPDDDDEEG